MPSALSIAEKIAQSKATGSGNWIMPAKSGVLIIKRVEESTGFKGDKYLVEFYVKASEDDPNARDEKGEVPKSPIKANPVGSSCTMTQMFKTNPEMAFGNVKNFCEKVAGIKDPSMEDFLEFYLSATEGAAKPETMSQEEHDTYQKMAATQPLRGHSIGYETVQKWNGDKDKFLTLPQWRHIPETPEEIAANRAMLDGKATAQA